tara:strand:+ start:198 stop:464 length:267 start_codon:yes stop_codon:yes gene_type:complete
MQKEFEEIKILINKIKIEDKNLELKNLEEIIKNKINKIYSFIDQSSGNASEKMKLISQIEEILELISTKEKKNSKIFEEFKNYLEKKK